MRERFEGIVLFKRKHREHDALVKIFTAAYGTKMFFIKRLEKPNHPMGSQLIPLTMNEYIGTINQEGLSFLTEASTIQFNRLVQSDYTVQDEAAEENEMTSINGNTYIGVPGNTQTGPLPSVKTENGFIK